MKQQRVKYQPEADERTPIRERWTAEEPGGSDQARAGALLRAAACVRPFGAKEMAEVAARLRGRERYRPRPLLWQVAVAAVFMLFGGALSASVARVLRIGYFAKPAAEHSAPPAAANARRASPVAPRAAGPLPGLAPPTIPVAEPAPGPALPPPGASPVAMHPGRALALRETPRLEPPAALSAPSLARAEPAPPPTASALARESRLLALAIAKLRQDGDAEQALILLDQVRKEFGPASALAPEANNTRIEALLRLGRHAQALALLDAMNPAPTGVGRELLVARAELRADRGRRSAALRDFDLLLAADGKADAVTERALFGRASCRSKLSDAAGAQRDLESYVARFPDGRFAEQARAALGTDVH
jgi:hypothetical protein